MSRRSFRPLVAWRAWRRLWRDPDDTAAVFEIIDALRGRAVERAYRRFAASETGARILAEGRDLLARLSDREALRALPAGSLGRTYAEFMDAEAISADGLVEASEAGGPRSPDERENRFYERLRDLHDLEHVVTGYGRDLRGEAALLAFSYAQTRSLGVGFIVLMAYLDTDAEERRLIREGFDRGRRSAWMPGVDWEAMLARPLQDVRAELHVGEASAYEPVWSAAAPAAA